MESRQVNLGVDHHNTSSSIWGLASNYRDQDQWDKAEVHLVRVITIYEKHFGKDHIHTMQSMEQLARFYQRHPGDHLEDAEQLLIQVLDSRMAVLGEDHPDTATSMRNLAGVYRDRGRLEDAEHLFERVWQNHRRVLGEDRPMTISSMERLVDTLCRRQDRLEIAETLAIQLLEKTRKVFGAGYHKTLYPMVLLARIWKALGRSAEEIKILEESLK
ncbi:hypothetical protein N7454_011088 [Penicillium verhagenii]|nr:hypothetical protein N7454_011088 [Penicillium verhagenii]